ncbi:MAG: glycosyltransferase family 39 protein [Planctomycetes bacterium]|nr:glycosyltransferase family 39 protein [Planctomycetota bacterium]
MMSPDGAGPRHPRFWALILLIALPCFLRLAPIQHGKPHGYIPDTHVVRNALGMAKDKNLVPPANKYSSYPNAIPYMLLPIYAAQYGIGRMNGEWAGAGEFGAKLMEDPWRAHFPARVLCALLASLAPLFVFLGLRRAGLNSGALWGAFFMGTCLLHVHYSGQERPWAPMTAAFCATGWAAAAFVDSKRYGYLVLAGLLAGLTVAMHPGGLGAALIPAVAWFGVGIPWGDGHMKQRLKWGFACAGAFLVVALILGYPHLLVHGRSDPDAVILKDVIENKSHFTLVGQSVVFGFRLETLKHLGSVFLGYDPAIILLGGMGLWMGLQSRIARPMVVFAVVWGAFFLTNVNDHVRYLLPLALGLTWCAGFSAERLQGSKVGRGLLIGLAGLALVQALRLDFVLRQPDTRHGIEQALMDLPVGSDVAIGVNGPVLPLDRSSLRRIADLRDLYGREQQRLERFDAGLVEGPCVRALPLQDVVELDLRHHSSCLTPKLAERFGNDLTGALRSLGSTHFLKVDAQPGNPRSPLVLDALPADEPSEIHTLQVGPDGRLPKLEPLRLAGDPIFQVLPGSSESAAPSARLPLVMDFPLRDLWRVSRPGPALSLYALEDPR